MKKLEEVTSMVEVLNQPDTFFYELGYGPETRYIVLYCIPHMYIIGFSISVSAQLHIYGHSVYV